MSELDLPNQEALDDNGGVATRKKSGRGGWRPGAGRKPILHEAVSFTGDIERADIEALEAIADERGVSLASVVREALSAYLKRRKRR